jgi:PAT family beta-lactamase induction signal transducer AmpG
MLGMIGKNLYNLILTNHFRTMKSFAAVASLGAFASATNDIASDGLYLIALKPEQQSFFVGMRSTFYRV